MNSSPSTARILIADTDPVTAARLEGMLRDGGYPNVRMTTDFSEVTRMFDKWSFDLLLIGFDRGSSSGVQIISDLTTPNDEVENQPIVLAVVNNSDRNVQERALIAGARDLISRPASWTEVMNRVRNALDFCLTKTA